MVALAGAYQSDNHRCGLPGGEDSGSRTRTDKDVGDEAGIRNPGIAGRLVPADRHFAYGVAGRARSADGTDGQKLASLFLSGLIRYGYRSQSKAKQLQAGQLLL